MKTLTSPVSRKERIMQIDVLRGLAIFGILMVNMQIFHTPIITMLQGYSGSASTADFISELFIKLFFEGKFYVMFSMLFGYGFYLFMHKQTDEGISIVPVFRRRVFYLLLFGILHVVLLWPGDILIFYALFGFVLLLYRNVSDRGLIKWAIWLSAVPVLVISLSVLMISLARMDPSTSAEVQQSMQEGVERTQTMIQEFAAIYATGSFADIALVRIREWGLMLPGLLFFYPMVLAMFLIGYLAARKGLIKNAQDHLPFFRKAFRWGLFIGLPLSGVYFWTYTISGRQIPGPFSVLSTAAHVYGGFFLSLAYVSAIVLLVQQGKLKRFSNLLAPVGRMALTNYLLHSIICTTLFLPYGFGLFGQVTHWQGIIISVAIFSVQIPFSRWWLNRFRFGPFEWLWRSLTYQKLQAFRS